MDPEAASLHEAGTRLVEQAEMMMALAADLSTQVEQAARALRQETASLRTLAGDLRLNCGRHPEVTRSLLAEARKLDSLVSRSPAEV
ncbi:MAG: hypothetical protein V2A77_00085, partial [Pseudomonadota bacterium]